MAARRWNSVRVPFSMFSPTVGWAAMISTPATAVRNSAVPAASQWPCCIDHQDLPADVDGIRHDLVGRANERQREPRQFRQSLRPALAR